MRQVAEGLDGLVTRRPLPACPRTNRERSRSAERPCGLVALHRAQHRLLLLGRNRGGERLRVELESGGENQYENDARAPNAILQFGGLMSRCATL
ncbi:MAG: hypothetical protein WBW93_09735 [Steroidobacteraceae bacterium]